MPFGSNNNSTNSNTNINPTENVRDKVAFFRRIRLENLGIDPTRNINPQLKTSILTNVNNSQVNKINNSNSIVSSLAWNFVKNYVTTPILNLIQRKLETIVGNQGLNIYNFVQRVSYIGLGHYFIKNLITKTTWGSILYTIYECCNLNSSLNSWSNIINIDSINNNNQLKDIPETKIKIPNFLKEIISLIMVPLSSRIVNKNLFQDNTSTTVGLPPNSGNTIIIEKENNMCTIAIDNTLESYQGLSEQNLNMYKESGYTIVRRNDLNDDWANELIIISMILGFSYYKLGPDITASGTIIYGTYRTLNFIFTYTPLPSEWAGTTSLLIGTTLGASYYIYKKYKHWTKPNNINTNINDESD